MFSNKPFNYRWALTNEHVQKLKMTETLNDTVTDTATDTAMDTDLKSIGDELKTKREKLSYTLGHVSEITRISLSCLKNIEEGNLDQLPGLVFTRGFIRNYAKMLDLDSDWMIETLNKTYANQNDTASNNSNEIYTLGQKSKIIFSSKLESVSIIFPVLIVLIAVIWYLQSNITSTSTLSESDTIEAVAEVDTTDKATLSEEQKDSSTEGTTATEPPQPEVKISPLNLVLIGKKAGWVYLTVDSNQPVKVKINEGERYEWPADKNYSLVMTTGETASIHLNGEEIEVDQSMYNKLYQTQLNEFSLTQINNN